MPRRRAIRENAGMPFDATIYSHPKVDCHCHILDPARFAYGDDVPYRPAGQETGSADYFAHVLEAYNVRHALLVEPNSGYGADNRCLIDAIANGRGRFKGIAVVANDAALSELEDLKAQGIVGIAFNVSLYGRTHYADIGPLLERLAALEMLANVQVQDDQLCAFAPMLQSTGVRVLIDHCGRPDVSRGLDAPGFAALLAMAKSPHSRHRTWVKVSGFSKFSQTVFPFADVQPFVAALLQAFGPEQCLWASDWPFLRASSRQDYGPLLQRFAASVADGAMREKILWQTPMRLFNFQSAQTTSPE
jgi:predicted TIM-barrel fold metal-dependent hydrolase